MRLSLLATFLLTCLSVGWAMPLRAEKPEAEEANESEARRAAEVEKIWAERGVPLLRTYCSDCHNTDYQEAEVDLDPFGSVGAIAAEQEMMGKVLEMIRFGAMPPDDVDQPTDEERRQLVDALETVLYSDSCDLKPKAGRVTIRRLNRAEYNNTIHDLFGIDLRPADEFPSDEVGAGFDNIGDVLSLPPMLFEKYMDAAEAVAEAVVIDPSKLEKIQLQRAGDALLTEGKSETNSFYKQFLFDDAFAWAEFEVPYDGQYTIQVRGDAPSEKAGKGYVGLYDEEGVLVEKGEFEYRDSTGGGTDSWTTKTELKKGLRRFVVAPLDPEADVKVGESRFEGIDRLTDDAIAAGRKRIGVSLEVNRRIQFDQTIVAVHSITVSGPSDFSKYDYPQSHKRLVGEKPGKNRSVEEAARPGIEWLLRRAFRAPVDEKTVDQYVALVKQGTENDLSYERAIRVALSAALVSPRFLFRIELPPDEPKPGETRELTDHQLASRLAYFLWSSTPDEALLDRADAGELRDDAVLREEVARMLKDPRADRLADNFAAQWLGLRNLDGLDIDAERFPDFDEPLRDAMREETRRMFLDVMHHNRSILELIDADYTFLNERLARHYGIEGIEGDEFRKTSLQGGDRAGILTHASILTLTSNPTRTSPVKRGKWVMENVLGTPPPDPPAGVPELEETVGADADAPIREQLKIHRENATCASCHRVMDVIGFGFENFDVTGRWREEDGPHPVDATGELPSGGAFDGPVALIRILKETGSEQFAKTTTSRLLTFALGRELTPADRCVIDEIVSQAGPDGFRLHDLVQQVVLSRPFRFHTLEGDQ